MCYHGVGQSCVVGLSVVSGGTLPERAEENTELLKYPVAISAPFLNEFHHPNLKIQPKSPQHMPRRPFSGQGSVARLESRCSVVAVESRSTLSVFSRAFRAFRASYISKRAMIS